MDRLMIAQYKEFQSSPTPRGGRYPNQQLPVPTNPRFNPRPPLEVGATVGASRGFKRVSSFNPRPPLEVGATRHSDGYPSGVKVSILAHP